MRAEDDSLVLFAGNAPRFYVSRGADFGSFRRDCSRPVLESADRRTPESYENWEWISAVYREGSRWHAFVSNEFHDTFAQTCLPGDPSPQNPCWYNSATHAVSTDGARTFVKPRAPAHVIAPPPHVWVPPQPGATPNAGYAFLEGYFSPYSIARKDDGFYYAIIGLIATQSTPPIGESCLIRTDRLDDPSSWREWDGKGFNDRMTSPYVTGNPAPACKPHPGQPGGGIITFNTYLDRYIHIDKNLQTEGEKPVCNLHFWLSADLFHWSPAQVIIDVRDDSWCPYDPLNPGLLEPVPVMYPTMIDHADTTVNFERTGRTPYLYYVRFNRGTRNDPLYWLDRDLVRVLMTFTRQD